MVELVDLVPVLKAVALAVVAAVFYAFLAFARSRDPETGDFERFESFKFVRTIVLAVALGVVAGVFNLADAAGAETFLAELGLYGILVIFVDLAAKAISRRLGWT